MHIVNDFFLLVWGERLVQQVVLDEKQHQTFLDLLSNHFELLCDSISIVLIFHPDTMARLLALSQTHEALGVFNTIPEATPHHIQDVQKNIFLFLIALGNLHVNQSITKRLELLYKEEVITYEHFRAISGVIRLIEEKKIEVASLHVKRATSLENYYKTAIHTLLTAVENLSKAIEIPTLRERLAIIPQKLENQRFSIGITGVMNAGKSTMLNALLGQEVLGTSVVPETANLTLIKYAKEPYAVVHFWNTKEWARIEEGAKSLKSLEAFVAESKAHFGETFGTFITQNGESRTISIDELVFYTSAKYSDKKCNLVKSVELYTDLKFVQDGVQIVDTPGLDDPVIQREEITLEYLSECDLMIHLMNAAQAATQKDIDFIIDALLYRNVAQLLVVITRIDAISEKELQEVIAYTKRSIEARLNEQNKGMKLNDIISRIVFIPIAGKLALMHKMGREKEALSMGYDLPKTGLPLVEAYLEEVLFGSNSQKARVIVSSNQKEIESLIEQTQKSFEQELKFLNLSQKEIEQAYHQHQEKKKAMQRFLEGIKSSVSQSKQEMEHYFITLQKFVTQRFDTLQSVVKRRISDDVNYEFSKHKKAPKEERIGIIIETAIKDGMVDLVRDYRYEFQKKMQSTLEYMNAKYGEFKSEVNSQTFDAKAFCEKHLGALLIFKNTTLLVAKTNEAIKKYGKNDESMFHNVLDTLFESEFSTVKTMLEEKLFRINHELLNSFVRVCEAPALQIEERFIAEEALIERAMHEIKYQTHNREARTQEIHEKERVIDIVLGDLCSLKESK